NDADGTFSYDSYVSGIGGTTLLHSGWGARFVDYDNDGWKDLLIAQAHDLDTIEKSFPDLHYREPPMLLRNVEGKKFVNVGPVSNNVFQQRWVGRGLAIGDIDNDGRVDAVITENGGPAHILMNRTRTANGTTSHWIGFRLVGHKSNRDGIGAVIRIDTSQGSQWETVTTSSSYLSASDVRAHFGLGRDTSVKMVEIHWPSGIVQILNDVPGGQYLRVDEPAPAAGR
ncbi:MAG: CRTAC1 family protein, partial [Acidobacteriaceae bacterium]